MLGVAVPVSFANDGRYSRGCISDDAELVSTGCVLCNDVCIPHCLFSLLVALQTQ